MIEDIKLKTNVCGRYKLTVRDGITEEVKHETEWFDNLITDIGLNRRGAYNNYFDITQIGSDDGTILPLANNNVALGARFASGSTQQALTYSCSQDAGDWHGSYIRTVRYGIGQATGTIREVGAGWSTVGSLFSRAILPSPVVVDPTQILDLTYEVRDYLPMVDRTGMITLNGINYYWITRAADVDNPSASAYYSHQSPSYNVISNVYNGGTIGNILSTPTGAASGITNVTIPYVDNSLEIKWKITADLTQCNFNHNSYLLQRGWGSFQIGFYESDYTTPKPIPKTSSQTFEMTFKFSWSRRP